jgi:DNA-binding transcriptional LysR family regulator
LPPSGECDLLLSPVVSEGDGLFRRLLIEDRYVRVLDPSNPLAANPITTKVLPQPTTYTKERGGPAIATCSRRKGSRRG